VTMFLSRVLCATLIVALTLSVRQHESFQLKGRVGDEEADYDDGCAVTKSCFVQNGNLATYLVTQLDGVDYLHVQLRSEAGRDWIALGFSYNTNMGPASVVECVRHITTSAIIMQHSYNDINPRSNVVIDSRGLIVDEATLINGVIRCSFYRPMTFSASAGDPRIFNLTNSQLYHLLLARGQISSTTGNKMQHVSTPQASSSRNLYVITP